MGNIWLKIKVWTKIAIFGLGLLYVLLFVYNNTGADRKTYFWWWFGHIPETSVFMLSMISFVAGIVATLLVRTTWTTYRQIRALQDRSRTNRLERDVSDMKSKAAMLQTKGLASGTTSAISGGASVRTMDDDLTGV